MLRDVAVYAIGLCVHMGAKFNCFELFCITMQNSSIILAPHILVKHAGTMYAVVSFDSLLPLNKTKQ